MPISRHELWVQRMNRYQACSLTVVEFCRREAVSVPSFYLWKKKLANAISTPAFVPVAFSASQPTPLRLLLPGGAEVQIDAGADLITLRKVFAAAIAETGSGESQ